MDAVHQGGVVDQGERGQVVGQVDDLDAAAGDGVGVTFREGAVQEPFRDHLEHRASRPGVNSTARSSAIRRNAARAVSSEIGSPMSWITARRCREMSPRSIASTPAANRPHTGRPASPRHQPGHRTLRHSGGRGQVGDQRPAGQLGTAALLRRRLRGPGDSGCGIRHQPDLRRIRRRPRSPPRLEPGHQPDAAGQLGRQRVVVGSSPEASKAGVAGIGTRSRKTGPGKRDSGASAPAPCRPPAAPAPYPPPRLLGPIHLYESLNYILSPISKRDKNKSTTVYRSAAEPVPLSRRVRRHTKRTQFAPRPVSARWSSSRRASSTA